jgi:hypothetical protein
MEITSLPTWWAYAVVSSSFTAIPQVIFRTLKPATVCERRRNRLCLEQADRRERIAHHYLPFGHDHQRIYIGRRSRIGIIVRHPYSTFIVGA